MNNFLLFFVIGVISWGFGCVEVFKFGVYMRVVNYVSWFGVNMV